MAELPRPSSSPVLPSVSQSPDQFGAIEGRMLQNVGGQLKELDKRRTIRKERKAIADVSAGVVSAMAELEVEWQNILETADPNDEEIREQFLNERVAEVFTQLEEQATTDAAKQQLQTMRAKGQANFLLRVEADWADLQAADVANKLETSIGDIVSMSANGTQTPEDAIAMAETTIRGFVGRGLTQTQADKAIAATKKEISYSSTLGEIERNPDNFSNIVANARGLTAGQRDYLKNYGKGLVNAAERQKFEEEKLAAVEARNNYLEQMTTDTGEWAVTPEVLNGIQNDPAFATETGRQRQIELMRIVDQVARRNKEKTGGEMSAESRRRIVGSAYVLQTKGELTVEELNALAERGLVTPTEYKDLYSRVTGDPGGTKVSPYEKRFMKTADTAIVTTGQSINPVSTFGPELVRDQFVTDAQELAADLRQKGVSEREIWGGQEMLGLLNEYQQLSVQLARQIELDTVQEIVEAIQVNRPQPEQPAAADEVQGQTDAEKAALDAIFGGGQ